MTLAAPPPTHLSPAISQLSTAVAGHLAPVVDLARSTCALLRRPCYNWQQATVTAEHDAVQQALGETADQTLLVLVPSRLPGVSEFIFELVQNAHTGAWRMCYAYGQQLTELTPAQRAAAGSFLQGQVGNGMVADYWK